VSRDLVRHETTVDNNIVYLNAFHGGKFGRCVQLTIQNGTYCQMTFKEAVELFETMIGKIKKVEEEYNRNPPWWEQKKLDRSLLLLTRTIKYDAKGNVISDTITNHLTKKTYPTPNNRKRGRKRNPHEVS
jgi:DNA-binding Lrp family transcriptional regulator